MIAKLLISQSVDIRAEEINKLLKKQDLANPHPDLLYFPNDSKLGIEQARKIKQHFSLKPYSAKGRAVVLEDASVMTVDAQNALLKTLEEPPAEALLILGAPSDAKFLPTILSRCQIVRLQVTGDSGPSQGKGTNYSDDIERLLRVSMEERFEYIEKLKDKEEFLHAMISYFRQKLIDIITHVRSNPEGPTLQKFTKELLQAEEWLAQNVNIRAILEYLMIAMPSEK